MQCVADIKFHGKSPMPCIKKAIADALDDGVDMLTDTKKILRFDEYEQLFPTDKQLDRLYAGCDETAYFETIEIRHSESTKTIITGGKNEPPPGIIAREESESFRTIITADKNES